MDLAATQDLNESDELIDVVFPTKDEDEEMREVERSDAIEAVVKETVNEWLELHGAKLFALEYSKADVKEKKRQLKPLRPGVAAVVEHTQKEGESIITTESARKRRRHG